MIEVDGRRYIKIKYTDQLNLVSEPYICYCNIYCGEKCRNKIKYIYHPKSLMMKAQEQCAEEYLKK